MYFYLVNLFVINIYIFTYLIFICLFISNIYTGRSILAYVGLNGGLYKVISLYNLAFILN